MDAPSIHDFRLQLAEAGWRASIDLREGIQTTIDWYRANKDSVREAG